MKRQCGTCTKCCEGYLSGSAFGKSFYNGRPCHFLSIGKGCTVYAKRPNDPCQIYKCAWLEDEEIPEWMKPENINALVDYTSIDNIPYIRVTEAGEVLHSKVISWLIIHALNNNLNLSWQVEGGQNYIGSAEFLQAMQNRRDASLAAHQTSI